MADAPDRRAKLKYLLAARAEVRGLRQLCNLIFSGRDGKKIVAQIRGVFGKRNTDTPPGGQNLARKWFFTPIFCLHTDFARLLDRSYVI